MVMPAADMIIIEKKRLSPAGAGASASQLSIEGQAIAAVLDRLIAKLPTVSERRLLEEIRKERE